MTVRSDTGLAAKLNPAGSTWLTCQTPIYRGSTIISQPLKYSVQSVETSGTNVVQAGRDQFEPVTNASPAIVGYFYDLRITAHDALFGHLTGREAIVTLPNGLVRRAPFGDRPHCHSQQPPTRLLPGEGEGRGLDSFCPEYPPIAR